METIFCPTCGAECSSSHATEPWPELFECLNCHDTRHTGIFTIYWPRTDEQIIKMVATLSADGDVDIKHLTDRLEALCDPEEAPENCHWFRHMAEDSFEDWCWECALLLRDYFNGKGEKPVTVWDGEEIPNWTPIADSVEVGGGWALESDSARICYRCGGRLDFSPTDEWAESEIVHFEEYGVHEDWWGFRIFLEAALEYGKKPDWYARVVLLAHRWIPGESHGS